LHVISIAALQIFTYKKGREFPSLFYFLFLCADIYSTTKRILSNEISILAVGFTTKIFLIVAAQKMPSMRILSNDTFIAVEGSLTLGQPLSNFTNRFAPSFAIYFDPLFSKIFSATRARSRPLLQRWRSSQAHLARSKGGKLE